MSDLKSKIQMLKDLGVSRYRESDQFEVEFFPLNAEVSLPSDTRIMPEDSEMLYRSSPYPDLDIKK